MMIRTISVLLLITLSSTANAALCGMVRRMQSTGARVISDAMDDRRRMCSSNSKSLDLDDLMAEGRSDSNGHFELCGTNAELKGVFNNLLNCCLFQPCQRKISIMIPDGYVTNGPKPATFYDVGTIELSGTYPGETCDCFQ
uniref:Uncharacterized protein n=1 Tax=Parascaris equorum TaxID=6256 RepID=A0A914RQ05_PAREQ